VLKIFGNQALAGEVDENRAEVADLVLPVVSEGNG